MRSIKYLLGEKEQGKSICIGSFMIMIFIEFTIETITGDDSYYQTSPWPIFCAFSLCGFLFSFMEEGTKCFFIPVKYLRYIGPIIGLCFAIYIYLNKRI